MLFAKQRQSQNIRPQITKGRAEEEYTYSWSNLLKRALAYYCLPVKI